jgi:hypothetical protein
MYPPSWCWPCLAFSLSENAIPCFQGGRLNVTTVNGPFYAGLKLSCLKIQTSFDGESYLSGAKVISSEFQYDCISHY